MASTFAKQCNEFVLELSEKNEAIIKETVIEYYRAIIFASPVASGRFRGNWFLTFQSPSNRVTRRTDRQGNRTAEKMKSKIMSAKNIDLFFLTNNLPYSEVIEFGGFPKMPKKGSWNKKAKRFEILSSGGYSKQAPNGVVRVNALRFRRLLEEKAKKVGYGGI